MNSQPQRLPIAIRDLEDAFEYLSNTNPVFADGQMISFLDLTTGAVITPAPEEEVEDLLENENLIVLPEDLYKELPYNDLATFVDSLPNDALRQEMVSITDGKGAFRRFKAAVYEGGNVELKHRWQWFETCWKRKRIVDWLQSRNIEPVWDTDIFKAPPLPDKRGDLLRAVLAFTRDARALTGVRRIALLGSLTTSKRIPKDVDLLVEVDDTMPLDKLAEINRRLLGKTIQTGDGCAADVFLCNPQGEYLGRVCSWKRCAPNIRKCCEAQHCGRRKYLSDDLQIIRLDSSVIAEPPLELWPELMARVDLPDDVRDELVTPLRFP